MKVAFENVKKYVLDRFERELPGNLFYHGIHHTRDDVLPAAERLAKLEGMNTDGTLKWLILDHSEFNEFEIDAKGNIIRF